MLSIVVYIDFGFDSNQIDTRHQENVDEEEYSAAAFNQADNLLPDVVYEERHLAALSNQADHSLPDIEEYQPELNDNAPTDDIENTTANLEVPVAAST